jgi:polyhydroxybutyrate depolymerase
VRRGVVLAAIVGFIAVACSGSTGRSSGTPRTTATTAPPTTRAGATVPSALPEGAAPGTTVALNLSVDGVTRTYRLHAPAALDPGRPAPLVLVLHGAMGNAARVETRYHWNPLSDRDGFFVVYPQGSLDQWNAVLDGRVDDDVSYLTALLDHLEGSFPIDRTRVYVAGLSNGAAMAYRIGCALSDRVAAIAPVEGSSPACQPSQPVSMVVVHDPPSPDPDATGVIWDFFRRQARP